MLDVVPLILFSAVSSECRASPPSTQLPLSQSAQTAPLPAPAHQPAHAGVPERGPANPASSTSPPQGPACPLVLLASSSATFSQSTAPAVILQSGSGLFARMFTLLHFVMKSLLTH